MHYNIIKENIYGKKKQHLWCKSVLGSIHITTVCGKQRSAKNDFELNAGALMKIQF